MVKVAVPGQITLPRKDFQLLQRDIIPPSNIGHARRGVQRLTPSQNIDSHSSLAEDSIEYLSTLHIAATSPVCPNGQIGPLFLIYSYLELQ